MVYSRVRPSVRHKSVLYPKRLNVGSSKQYRTIPKGLLAFLCQSLGETPMGSPGMRVLNAGGVGKIAFFKQSSILWLRSRTAKNLCLSTMIVTSTTVHWWMDTWCQQCWSLLMYVYNTYVTLPRYMHVTEHCMLVV